MVIAPGLGCESLGQASPSDSLGLSLKLCGIHSRTDRAQPAAEVRLSGAGDCYGFCCGGSCRLLRSLELGLVQRNCLGFCYGFCRGGSRLLLRNLELELAIVAIILLVVILIFFNFV